MGLVYLGVAGPDGASSRELHLRGDRDAIRNRSVALAMHSLRLALESRAAV